MQASALALASSQLSLLNPILVGLLGGTALGNTNVLGTLLNPLCASFPAQGVTQGSGRVPTTHAGAAYLPAVSLAPGTSYRSQQPHVVPPVSSPPVR